MAQMESHVHDAFHRPGEGGNATQDPNNVHMRQMGYILLLHGFGPLICGITVL